MKSVKLLSLVLVLTLFAKWSTANENAQREPHSIPIKATSVQGVPKTSSILASINGHALSVVFTENFGQVFIEVTDTNGGPVDMNDMYTPNGYNAYIHYAGSYVITFTFADGDVYYGEFDVVE